MASTAEAMIFYRNADEEVKERLATALFYRELESIRRDEPLLDPREYPVKQLALFDRDGDEGAPAAGDDEVGLRGGARPAVRTCPRLALRRRRRALRCYPPWCFSHSARSKFLAKPVTVELVDDDDDEQDDNPTAQPEPPGPLTAMRLDVTALREQIGYALPFEEQFPKEIEAAAAAQTQASRGAYTADQETMLQSADWRGYLESYRAPAAATAAAAAAAAAVTPVLYKGFPMAEEVVFVKHPNYWTRPVDRRTGKLVHNGQCYWLAVALLVYGDASAWLRAKAEHLCFLETVLRDPRHPRHAFYARENRADAWTHATGPADADWSGVVNLWERLHIPGCWTSEDMCYLTADVYGVFLVLYKYDSDRGDPRWRDRVYDMKTFGAYNNRHIFLCFSHDNHFQPMVPNDYYAYEFKLPRLTLQSTRKYRLVTREHRRLVRDGPRHHWRGQPQTLPPLLAHPSFTPDHLRRAAGYAPSEQHRQPSPEDASASASASQYRHRATQTNRRNPLPSAPRKRPASAVDSSSSSSSSSSSESLLPLPAAKRPSRRQPAPSSPSSSSSSSAPRAFTPVNKPRPSSSTAAAQRRGRPRAPPSAEVISISSSSPHREGDSGQEEEGQQRRQDEEVEDDDDDDDNEGVILQKETTYRPATKTFLARSRIALLRQWCSDLGLGGDVAHAAGGGGNGTEEWSRDQCVAALLRVRVEIRMRKDAENGWVVDDGVGVVRVGRDGDGSGVAGGSGSGRNR